MARHGRLRDALIAVGRVLSSPFRSKAAGPPSGEAGVARLVGPWGGGSYGAQPLEKSQQVLHFKEWNYVCVDYICSRIAQHLPTAVLAAAPSEVKAYELHRKAFLRGKTTMPPPRAFAPAWWKAKAIGPARGNEDLEYLDDDHPLVRLLNDPNDPETGVSLWYEAELFNCLTGEDFIWVSEDGAGRPSELWVIPSHWVKPICEGKDRLVDYFEVSPRSGAVGVQRFDPDTIIWTKKPSSVSKIYPQSPIQAQANTIDAYEKTQAARSFQLDNGIGVCGVLQQDPTAGTLDDKTIERLEARFMQRYAGVANFGRPMILEGGLQWVPPPADQELANMQTTDQLRRYVMAGWKLDEVVLGFASVANRAAMVAAIANVGTSAINPRRKWRAGTLTEKLAKRFDSRARIFYEDDTPVDPESRRADYQVGGTLYAAAPNDYRTHVLELEPFPEEVYDRPLTQPGLINPVDTADWDGEAGDLRGTVGGLQAIQSLQQSYYGGQIPRDAAIATMQTVFGFSQSEAEEMFPEVQATNLQDEGGQAGLALSPSGGQPPRPGMTFDPQSHHWRSPVGDDSDLSQDFKAAELVTKHGPPPFPGAVFDEGKHRWVSQEQGNEHATSARTLAAGIKRFGQKAVDAALTVGAKAYEIGLKAQWAVASSGVLPDDILDTVEDSSKIYWAKGTGDWLSQNIGVGGNVTVAVGSRVLAYGLVKLKQGLAKARGKNKAADEPADKFTIAAEVFGEMLKALGAPDESIPDAKTIREWLDAA